MESRASPPFSESKTVRRVIIQSNRDSHSPKMTAAMFRFRISVFAIVVLALGGNLLTYETCTADDRQGTRRGHNSGIAIAIP